VGLEVGATKPEPRESVILIHWEHIVERLCDVPTRRRDIVVRQQYDVLRTTPDTQRPIT